MSQISVTGVLCNNYSAPTCLPPLAAHSIRQALVVVLSSDSTLVHQELAGVDGDS